MSGGLLRSLLPQRTALELAASVRPARGLEKLPSCPSCTREMGLAGKAADALGFELEQCPSCDLWWFDRGEATRAVELGARRSLDASGSPRPPAALEARRGRVQRSSERAQRRLQRAASLPPGTGSREIELRLPGNGLKALITLFGMPAEEDAPSVTARPLVTWTLAACAALVSLLALNGEPQLFERLALVPAEGGGFLGLHYLSYFFLHGSLFHLAANLYFLVVFGDNVEDLLKPARYLVLLVVATAVSAFAHVLLDPRSDVPLVGASGGISAVVVYYGLALPKVRLSLFLFLFWVRIAAIWALLAWLAVQCLGIFDQLGGRSQVSFAGHLGGALVGCCGWLMTRPSAAHGVEVPLRRPRY